MIEAVVMFGILCLSTWVVCALEDANPVDFWGDDDA